MSHQPFLEMDDLSSDVVTVPAYHGSIDRPYNGAQDTRERLIPRKPVLSPEITQTPKFEPLVNQTPVGSSLGRRFPQDYEHIQGSDDHGGDMWVPGIWSQFPWRIILPLTLCLACLSGTIIILTQSDGQPVADWSVSPTVWLAFLTAILNMSLRYAFKQGVAISWWYKAVRGGTVKDLHKHWSSGDGFWSALTAGRYFSLVSLGSIAATLIVIDQPLIQRASTIVSTPRTYLTNVTANIAPEIPYGYTGFQAGRDQSQQLMTQPTIAAFNDFNSRAPITSGFLGCNGSCSGYVEAGGLAVQCSTISGPVKYLQGSTVGIGIGADGTLNDDLIFADDHPFSVNFTLEGASSETVPTQILMVVAYTNQSTYNCTGNRVQRTCSLRPATLKYPVMIQNGTLTLGDLIMNTTVQAFQPSSETLDTDGGGDYSSWTLGGIYTAALSLFNASAVYYNGGAVGEQIVLQDTLSNQFIDITPGPGQPNPQDAGNFLSNGLSYPQACAANWTDPTNHIISSLNEIAFRLSIGASNFYYRNTTKPPPPQVITMVGVGDVNVFHSEHKYMIAMIVFTVAMMGFVIPTLTGWWELGRHTTLDPIEIGKAFDAPMLRGPGSNAPLWQLIQDHGSRGIRYGEAEGFNDGQTTKRQLKLGNPHEIVRPSSGVVYQ